MSEDIAARNYTRITGQPPHPSTSKTSKASMEFMFGTVWEMPELSWRERRLIALTCTAISGQAMPLETHVQGALDSGDFTVEELQTFSLYLSAYAGFPIGSSIGIALQKLAQAKGAAGS